jgi:thymidylate kinase
VDKTGKSTLIRKLIEKITPNGPDIKKMTFQYPPKGLHPTLQYEIQKLQYFWTVENMFIDSSKITKTSFNEIDGENVWTKVSKIPKQIIICDRFHLGEAVYAPIYRDYTLDYGKELEALMPKYTILVLMNPINSRVVYERHEKEKENFLKRDDIEIALGFFRDAFEKSIIPYKMEVSSDKIEVTEEAVSQLYKYIFKIEEIQSSTEISEYGTIKIQEIDLESEEDDF